MLQDGGVEAAAGADDGYQGVGSREDLDRFLTEYRLDEDRSRDRIRVRTTPPTLGGNTAVEYLVHESLLRSHGAFPCAGDHEAVTFCQEIADAMVLSFAISPAEARARVNRQWSQPEDRAGRVPRIWLVGGAIVYHEEPAYWAAGIYYGFVGRWWSADAERQPLPAP